MLLAPAISYVTTGLQQTDSEKCVDLMVRLPHSLWSCLPVLKKWPFPMFN